MQSSLVYGILVTWIEYDSLLYMITKIFHQMNLNIRMNDDTMTQKEEFHKIISSKRLATIILNFSRTFSTKNSNNTELIGEIKREKFKFEDRFASLFIKSVEIVHDLMQTMLFLIVFENNKRYFLPLSMFGVSHLSMSSYYLWIVVWTLTSCRR